MTPEDKKWIDSASYEDLLRRWRTTAVTDPVFFNDTGEYYKKVLAEKRAKVGNAEHVRASKAIGVWF